MKSSPMIRLVLAFVALMVVTSNASAQNVGEAWKNMESFERLLYVRGYTDGVNMAKLVLDAQSRDSRADSASAKRSIAEINRTVGSGSLDHEAIINLVTQFYENPANAQVLLVFAVRHAVGTLRGLSQAQLDHIAEVSRRMSVR